ncbi:hypothetical protein CERSUDRAFT_98824 [Gelatoporia subvermispora B]|uniref:Uncharacterized protein n=1 Tax=Ceriporiopsis subvermispora (strain B) TaxID=914234 RepID=M2R2V6_CERS8|nr:hypothetical protein CERSUDRAFT_98824 [Gelatoporia subvermispora B]
MSISRRISLTSHTTRVRRSWLDSPTTEETPDAAAKIARNDEHILTAFGDVSTSDEEEVQTTVSPTNSPSRIRRPAPAKKRDIVHSLYIEEPPVSPFTNLLVDHLRSAPGNPDDDFRKLCHKYRQSKSDEVSLLAAMQLDDDEAATEDATAGNSSLESSNSSAILGTLLGAPSAASALPRDSPCRLEDPPAK